MYEASSKHELRAAVMAEAVYFLSPEVLALIQDDVMEVGVRVAREAVICQSDAPAAREMLLRLRHSGDFGTPLTPPQRAKATGWAEARRQPVVTYYAAVVHDTPGDWDYDIFPTLEAARAGAEKWTAVGGRNTTPLYVAVASFQAPALSDDGWGRLGVEVEWSFWDMPQQLLEVLHDNRG